MTLKYYKQEQRDSFDMHQTRTVYRLHPNGHVSPGAFVRAVAHRHGFSESTISGVLSDVAEELALLLGEGRTVAVPGIGAFSLGVRLNPERQRELQEAQDAVARGEASSAAEPNARAIELHHLNFRKDKELYRQITAHFNHQTLQRTGGKVGSRITIDDTTQRQRLDAAHAYLRTHPYMRIGDYAALTGLSRTSAQRELRELVRYQHSGITAQGRGSHRVYVLRAKKEDSSE